MAEYQTSENNIQEDWCFVENNIHLFENLEFSDMEIEPADDITNPVGIIMSENTSPLQQEDLCPEVVYEFKLSEDVSDPGLYDQFLPDIEISPVKSYKHRRNKQLNFYLDLLLGLTVATALGLSTGYFIGWSDRCLEQDEILPMCFNQKISDVGFKHEADLETIKPFSTNFFENVIVNDIKKIGTVKSESDIMQVTSSKKGEFGYAIDVNSAERDVLDLSSIDNSETLNTLKQQNEVIIKLYKNFLNRFHFESSNQSVQIEKLIENKKHDLTNNLKVFIHEDINSLKNSNTNRIAENNLGNITKLMQKIHTDVIGNKYNENTQLKQFRTDLSFAIKSIQELIHLTDLKNSNVVNAATENSLKAVDDIFEEFKLHIDQKVTDLENIEDLQLSDSLPKKNKIRRKMIATLVTSIDKLLQVSMKFMSAGKHNQSNIRADKIINSSLKIIQNLENQWERNKNIGLENRKKNKKNKEFEEVVKKPYFKKQNQKESDNQNAGESNLKYANQNAKGRHIEKQRARKSESKNMKQNTKESDCEDKKSHLKNIRQKSGEFHLKNKKQNTVEFNLKNKGQNTKESHLKNKKQNAEESHSKTRNIEESYHKDKKGNAKESRFENKKQNKKEYYPKKQNAEESLFTYKKRNREEYYLKNKNQNIEESHFENENAKKSKHKKENVKESKYKNGKTESHSGKQISNKESF